MIQTTKVQLSGLTCSACEKVIGNKLKNISDVQEVQVQQNGFTTIIAERKIETNEIKNALSGTHYKVINNKL